MALEETGLMTPIKKKGGRHADQPVESAAPEQRQATQLGSPASLVGWTRRLCLAALHTQKARPSRPDLHEGLRLHRQIVPKLEVRSPALHPGGRSGCRRRNRHWQEEEAAGAVRLRCTSQEKEGVSALQLVDSFLRLRPLARPSWRTTGAQSLPRGQPPALQRGPDTHLLPQGCLRA